MIILMVMIIAGDRSPHLSLSLSHTHTNTQTHKHTHTHTPNWYIFFIDASKLSKWNCIFCLHSLDLIQWSIFYVEHMISYSQLNKNTVERKNVGLSSFEAKASEAWLQFVFREHEPHSLHTLVITTWQNEVLEKKRVQECGNEKIPKVKISLSFCYMSF